MLIRDGIYKYTKRELNIIMSDTNFKFMCLETSQFYMTFQILTFGIL